MPRSSVLGASDRHSTGSGRSALRRLADWRIAAAGLAVGTLGAGLAAGVTGVGAASSVSSAGAVSIAQNANGVVLRQEPGVVQPTAFTSPSTTMRDTDRTSRTSGRPALSAAAVSTLAEQRAASLAADEAEADEAAQVKAVERRAASLRTAGKETSKRAAALAEVKKSAVAGSVSVKALAALDTGGKSCLPVSHGYTVAARFGDTGSWSRYHTGIDFADAIGTPIHAPAAGIVTNAGTGKASGWAGNYVTIQYADGKSTLMAHMSTVSVEVGDVVKPCQVVGAIGMTGRSFGPHLHFELYPVGVEPGDLYKAIDPAPWLKAQGLRP